MGRGIRTLIVLVVAVVTAGVATWFVHNAVQRLSARQVEAPEIFTVVAAKSLPVGTKLGRDDVKLAAWPAKSPVPGAYATVDKVVDRGLIASALENEPLTESKLAPLEAGAGLPPTIQPGMRAISVKVNEVIGVAGFVVPGTFVDVLVTVRQQEQRDSMTRAVVSHAQVLTAGTRYDQEKAKSGEPIPATVVTLAVTPQDAERIALAESEGKIMLALRNPLDIHPTVTPGMRLTSLMGPPPSPSPRPLVKPVKARAITAAVSPSPPPPPPSPKPYTVEAIRAAKRTEEVVR